MWAIKIQNVYEISRLTMLDNISVIDHYSPGCWVQVAAQPADWRCSGTKGNKCGAVCFAATDIVYINMI